MRHFLRDLRHRAEFVLSILPFFIIRNMPFFMIKPCAVFLGRAAWLVPGAKKIVLANLESAMPELDESERKRIAGKSFIHIAWNLIEFFWASGNPRRIVRCYHMPDSVKEALARHTAAGERVIFVNPHLGSWEASGVVAPFYAGLRMAAIAKPMKNPYMNKLLNAGGRERTRGLEVIFSRGAMRASISALRSGKSLGTLIDQNTRVRDGGEFVDFFGIPVPSSTAPATLKRYCDAHDIPVVIIYGSCLRLADGRNTAHIEYLSKNFSEYAGDREVLQELMAISEKYIRNDPEQYLWFYKRFQYIMPGVSDEVRKRYPYYATDPDSGFFNRTARKKQEPQQ